MIRPLRAEWRHSPARRLGLILLVASVLLLAESASRAWWREWLMFSYFHTVLLFLLVPLVMAGGALLGRRDNQTGAEELMSTTGRPRWQRAMPGMAAIGGVAAGVHLLLLLAGATLIGLTGSYLGAIGFVIALIDALVLVGAAWVGVAVGRLWTSPVLPAALAAVVLGVQFFVDGVDINNGGVSPFANLSLLAQPPGLPWESPDTRTLLGRLALGAGLTVGGFLLAGGRSLAGRAAAFAALAAGVAGLMFIPGGTLHRYEVNAGAQELVCAEGTPRVCLTAVHAFALADAAPEVRRGLAALAKLPDAPREAAEFRPPTISKGDSQQWKGAKPLAGPGTVLFTLPDGKPEHLAEKIVNGAGTWENGCQFEDSEAAGAVGAWLLGTDRLVVSDSAWLGFDNLSSQDEITALVTGLRRLPEAEQVRRVVAYREAAVACRPGLEAILTGKARS